MSLWTEIFLVCTTWIGWVILLSVVLTPQNFKHAWPILLCSALAVTAGIYEVYNQGTSMSIPDTRPALPPGYWVYNLSQE